MMMMTHDTILFQMPCISVDTPVAVNIWARNIARAFSLAKIQPTLLYLGMRRAASFMENGVTYVTSPLLQSCMASLPKLSALTYPIVQQHLLRRLSRNYGIVAPLGGPYSLRDESGKVHAVKLGGAAYLHPILEHPNVRFPNHGEPFISTYLDSVADMYDILMPITTYLRDLYAKHGRMKPTLQNPIVVDTSVDQEDYTSAAASTIDLLYCGNLEHHEEMMLLFDAFSEIHRSSPATRLKVVGGGCSRNSSQVLMTRYRAACLKRGMLDSVHFHGTLPHHEVLQQYRAAHAFLLPRPFRDYSQAGFPTKIGEYLATGKPVITTGTGDIPLYLVDGVSAYIVMDDDPVHYARRVLEALADPGSGDIGRAGARVARENFSIEATADRIRVFWMSL